MIPDDARILLDRSILLHLVRKRPAGAWVYSEYRLGERPRKPLISRVTVGECLAFSRTGKNPWGEDKKRRLNDLLQELPVVELNNGPVTELFADFSGHLYNVGQRLGNPHDIWIAACAVAVDATVLTADRDFARLVPLGLRVERIDPEELKKLNRDAKGGK
ncbi:MAG: type II toxin-antitoxin system VapC family toxin [Chrysiogenetes bacterium]|nr:type II toxin-antitoxin system VapC family toxin [Chrysiogenetes bacterium]